MPKFKTVEFIAQNSAGAVDKISIDIDISADGTFYAHVPEKLRVSFDEERIRPRARNRVGFFVTSAPTLAEITAAIKEAHVDFMRPTVKEEPVILYNIESHVSFAVDGDGKIFPNAGFPDAKWADGEDKTYGGHHACRRAPGGYSLIVGAKAMMKKTTTYGKNVSVSYSSYYKGGSHLVHENPAQLLNAWCSMDLPEEASEIPYSDEAAMFFFGLLQSMAELNRRVQEFTNTPEKLALAISRNAGMLMLPAPPPAAHVSEPTSRRRGGSR